MKVYIFIDTMHAGFSPVYDVDRTEDVWIFENKEWVKFTPKTSHVILPCDTDFDRSFVNSIAFSFGKPGFFFAAVYDNKVGMYCYTTGDFWKNVGEEIIVSKRDVQEARDRLALHEVMNC